jgi:hypothetical protein
MRMRRTTVALLFIGFLATWSPWASDALAATATVSDLTDFITRLGGYLFTTTGDDDTNKSYWVQVSYKVTPAATSSNITTITMTKYNPAAVYKNSGNGLNSTVVAPTTTSTPTALFGFCTVDTYTVETVTLDLRDLSAKTTPGSSGLSVTTKTAGSPPVQVSHQIWSIVLHTNGGNYIRQNTQTLPPNCPYGGWDHQDATAMTQKDVSTYEILFADEGQANQFRYLASNVIPTLNPPVLIGATPGP